jgi:phosphate:Na+ symporter
LLSFWPPWSNPFEGALYLVFGDNIGTTITAWLAGIGSKQHSPSSGDGAYSVQCSRHNSDRYSNLLGIYTQIINKPDAGKYYEGQNIARHIANGHTFFNVINTLIFLPFSHLLAKLALKIIPPGKENSSLGEPNTLITM